uniref:Slc24a-2 n=1 Tax=Schmidtea mediterranea TaxID=79327 RepID=A0A0H3YKA1_SCHMD|nr:slc24a-2 [Schmidtea mediterranea]
MDLCTPLNFSSSNYSNICQYITFFSSCIPNLGFINYFQWQYCSFDNRWAPTILMLLWFLFLLTGIATAADSFLAPCLVVVAKTMRMSENLAGVTLLALGNGAADVFSSLSAVTSTSNPNVGLAFGGILGAGIFVNSITAGIIMIITPFKLMKRPIIKDFLFYFSALIWCMFIFIRRQIELWSSLVFLILYAIYILVTVISRLLYVRHIKSKATTIKTNNSNITIRTPDLNVENAEIQQKDNRDSSTSNSVLIFKDNRSKANQNITVNNIEITVTASNDEDDQKNDLNIAMRKSSSISDFIPIYKDIKSKTNTNKIVNNIEITVTPPKDDIYQENYLNELKSISSSISDFNCINIERSNTRVSFGGSLRNDYSYDNPNYVHENHKDHFSRASTTLSSFKSNFSSINDKPNFIKECYEDKLDHLNVPQTNYQGKSRLVTSQHSCPHESECNAKKRVYDYLNSYQFERSYNSFENALPSLRSSIIGNHQKHSYSIKRKHHSARNSMTRSSSHRSIGSLAQIIIDKEHEKERMEKHPTSKKITHFRSISLTIINESPLKTKIRFRSMSENEKSKSDITNEWGIIKGNHKIPPENENENKFNLETGENGDSVVTFPGPWKHFALTILPVDLEEWREQSGFSKFLSIIQSPFMFILTLTIPIVDETAYLKGWCKILNCIHCLLSLVFWVLLPNVYNTPFGTSNFLLVYLFIILGFIVGVVVAFTSKVDKPPIYQPFFAFIGLITSILWIYEIANEIVNILSVFGVVFNISSVILGLSVLAFANSTGDLVSNVTLAKNNYPRIGYSACVGGPLFNLLVGIGIPFSIRTFSGPIPVQLTGTSIVLIFTIMLVTTLNLLCLPLMKFQPKRFYGIILIIIYIIYFVLVILFAVDIIKVTL